VKAYNTHATHSKSGAQPLCHGQKCRHISSVPRPHLAADGTPITIDDSAYNHLLQMRTVILVVPTFPDALAALALEIDRSGVEKDLQEAEEWFKKADVLGQEAARERLPYFVDARRSFEEMARRMEESSGPSREISVEGGPGDTIGTAFVIKGVRDNLEGITIERAILEHMLGERGADWDVAYRKLVAHDGRLFDLFQIRIPEANEHAVFFDVTDFVGTSSGKVSRWRLQAKATSLSSMHKCS